MRTTARAARGLTCAVALLATYGWLDLLRRVPGPQLPLVLPLRANGGGDGVSPLVVLLVFGVTFAVIARIVRPRASMLWRAALVRGALVAAFTVTVGALQQGIVEQSRPAFAWGSALWLAWPWLAAAASAAGTLAAAPRAHPHPDAPPCQEPVVPQPAAAGSRALEVTAA